MVGNPHSGFNKNFYHLARMDETRRAERIVVCPKCGAASGKRCIGVGGRLRDLNHTARTNLYNKASR